MGKPAARIGDFHVCPKHSASHDHKGGPVLDGISTILIGGRPAAVVGARCACQSATDTITRGSTAVLMGNRLAARVGDATAHGGVVSEGYFSVLIGG